MDPEEARICTKCKEYKPLDHFYKKDGHPRSRCKICFHPQYNARLKTAAAARYAANADAIKKKAAEYRKNNREKHNACSLASQRKNPQIRRANIARYKSTLRQATPKWLNDEQKKEIKFHYELTKELQWLSSERLTVDHIIPIQGGNVTGLHVPWNLQIITKSQNCSKGNRVEV